MIVKIMTSFFTFITGKKSYPMLYIELAEKQLYMGILKKQQHSLAIDSPKVIALNNSEIVLGRLYNPSFIQQSIAAFIAENNLYKPKTIVCSPQLSSCHDLLHHVHVLQIALCISKAPLNLVKITEYSLQLPKHTAATIKAMQNHLAALTPSHAIAPIRWILGSLLCLMMLGVGLAQQSMTHQIDLATLMHHNLTIHQELPALKAQTTALKQQQQLSKELAKKILDINYLTTTNLCPGELLTVIAHNMPQSSWLTTVHIGNELPTKKISSARSKQSSQPHALPPHALAVKIEGITPNINDITTFIHALSTTHAIENPVLAGVKKIKRKPNTKHKAPPLYTFVVLGSLNTPPPPNAKK